MEDVINPVSAIRRLYAQQPAESKSDDSTIKQHFQNLQASGAKIPLLTPHTVDLLPNNTLVRFRGLVQDMLNPEFYVGEYKLPNTDTWQTSKYCDQVEDDISGEGVETRIAERKPLIIIPVPNEAPWVQDIHSKEAEASVQGGSAQGGTNTGKGKRQRDGGDQDDDVSMMVSEGGVQDGMDTDTAVSGMEKTTKAGRHDNEPSDTKQPTTAGGAKDNTSNESLPEGSCIVYVYDNQELKLNDVVEVVGIVSKVPELAALESDLQGMGQDSTTEASLLDQEILASHVPTSKAVRIHAVLIQPQNSIYPQVVNPASVDVVQGRARTLGFLSMVLGGDDLAAEYLLLQLVSRVHTRTGTTANNGNAAVSIPGGGVVGTLPLNITKCPPAESSSQQDSTTGLSTLGSAVVAALQGLCPRVLSSPMSIDTLNKRPWWPRRNQNTLRMLTGLLQLAAGTQVVFDETVMAAGQLQEVGLRNLNAVQDLMRRQQVAYDFEYFGLDQPADSPVTVLSIGKTILKGTGEVEVPLCPTAPTGDGKGVAAAVASADLDPARAYLAVVRELSFSIPEDVAKYLETELAAARSKDPNLTQDSFHRWLNVARLLAVSHGEGSLSVERWQQAMALEQAREQRLK